MQDAWNNMVDQITAYVPNLLGALAILVLGWLAAMLIAWLVRSGLQRTTLDNRLTRWVGVEGAKDAKVEVTASRVVFYILMLFVLVGFFQALGLTIVTEPLNDMLGELSAFIPRLLGAAFLLLLAWAIANGVRLVITKALAMTSLDERIAGETGATEEGKAGLPLSKTLGETAYWLVFLLFLPAVLDALALQGILDPVKGMTDKLLGFLPNLFAALLILAVGWFAARIVQRIVRSLLVSLGADRLSERVGLSRSLGKLQLSGSLAMVVYVLILLPVIVAALNALQVETLSRPASQMLEEILAALPNVFAAFALVAIAYVVGRLASALVASLLGALGFDALVAKLGLGRALSGKKADSGRTPAQLVGFVVLLAILLIAVMEAAGLLGFEQLSELVSDFYVFGSRLVLGLVIFALGLFLANLAHAKVSDSGARNAQLLALVARVAILVVVGAMALDQVGVAPEVVNLVLGLLLGAVAVATAIAFGLGAREPAGKLVDGWLQAARSRKP